MARWSARHANAAKAVPMLALLGVVAALVAGCGGSAADEGESAKGKRDKLVTVRTVSFRTAVDGSTVKGLVAVPRGVPSSGCVIFQSGFRSTKEDTAYAWQGFAALGLSTFSLDFRYQGERAANPDTYKTVLKDPATFANLVRGTVGDLRSAIDYLEKQPYCRRTVAYGGVSLGGAIGTILAARDQRVKALALVVAPGNWRLTFRAPGSPYPSTLLSTPAKRRAVRKAYDPLDPERYIARVSPRPVLILNGDEDDVVTPENARVLQRAARAPKTIINFRGGHNAATSSDATVIADAIGSFFLRTITQPRYGIKGESNGTFFQP